MKPRLIRKWSPVVVKWVDALTVYGPQSSSEYIENYAPMVRRTSGFYLTRNDDGVFLAETDDREGACGGDCDTITCIPLGMILDIECTQSGQITVRRARKRS